MRRRHRVVPPYIDDHGRQASQQRVSALQLRLSIITCVRAR